MPNKLSEPIKQFINCPIHSAGQELNEAFFLVLCELFKDKKRISGYGDGYFDLIRNIDRSDDYASDGTFHSFHKKFGFPYYISFCGKKEDFTVCFNDFFSHIIRSIRLTAILYKRDGYSDIQSFFTHYDARIQRKDPDEKMKGAFNRVKKIVQTDQLSGLLVYEFKNILNNNIFGSDIKQNKREKAKKSTFLKALFQKESFSDMSELVDFIHNALPPSLVEILYEEIVTPESDESRQVFSDAAIAGWIFFCASCAKYENSPSQWASDHPEKQKEVLQWIKQHIGKSLTPQALSKEIDKVKKGLNPWLNNAVAETVPFLETAEEEKEHHKSYLTENDLAGLETEMTILPPDEQIDLQHKAFFWIPGERKNFWEELPEFAKHAPPGKPMFLAYFYRWLRENSGATRSEIAEETSIGKEGVYKWMHNILLHYPYLVRNTNISPVYFSKAARSDLSLTGKEKPAFRAFNLSLKNVKSKTATYRQYMKEIEPRKRRMWHIYELLRNADIFGAAEMGGPLPDGLSFTFQIKNEDEIEEIHFDDENRMPRTFVYISGVKVNS